MEGVVSAMKFGQSLRFVVLPVLVVLGGVYSIVQFAKGISEPPQEEPCRHTYYDGDHYHRVTCKHAEHRLVVEGSVVKCLCERSE